MSLSYFEKFSGVYCSGSFISNPSAVTALSLLFDELYIPNNLELAIDFAKHYRFNELSERIRQNATNMSLRAVDDNTVDPLQGLTPAQQEVVKQYYLVAQHFFVNYRDLVGPFIKTNIIEGNDIFDVKLIKQGKPGEMNTYEVAIKPFIVSFSDGSNNGYMQNILSRGAIPVICDRKLSFHQSNSIANNQDINAQSLACILAMKSIELVIPPTKPANSEIILEARYKLRDYLPVFWS